MRKIIAFIGYLLIAILVIFLYLDYHAGKPLSSSPEIKIFIIEKGESLKEIGENLEKEGFIKDKTIFILYSFLKNLRKNFLPGQYELKKNFTLKEVIKILTSPESQEKKITIIEGWKLEEIVSYLENEGLVKKEDFLREASILDFWREKYEFLKDPPAGQAGEAGKKIKNLEGFLFPDTYRVYLSSGEEEIISKMLNNFEKKVWNEIKEEIKKQGKTTFEVITLASIIEKEVAIYEDREMVADIFLRRLASGIALQADSTVNYVTGKNVRQASLEDIKIDSPYNTYKYKGLPPGPISNPGLDSIKAVISPKKNLYWYFLNLEDGTTIYSKTFEEHKANKIKYLKGSAWSPENTLSPTPAWSERSRSASLVPATTSLDVGGDTMPARPARGFSWRHNPAPYFKEGELLVKYKNDEKIYKFIFDQKDDIEKTLLRLSYGGQVKKELLEKEIEIIEPNYIYYGSLVPNDPYFREEWFLEQVEAQRAWDIVPGGSEGVIIALIDSGVDINHPDLKENIWINPNEILDGIDNDENGYIDDINGWDFVENKPDPRPKFFPSYTINGMNHGTVVAGLAAAVGQNNQGIIGLAFKTKIMPIRVLNNRGEGSLEDVIKGIDYAIKNRADIVNLSFVGPNPSELLFQAIKKAWEANIFIVAAAGNNSENYGDDLDKNPLYPICLDSNFKENIIIGVTATEEKDKKASFANYGSRCVDISAPGTRVYSTLFYFPEKKEFREYYGGYWSGTSVATPLVAGTAALIRSISPLISNREIRNIILDTAENIDGLNENLRGKLGQGRLNTYRAVGKTYQKLIAAPHYRYIVTSPGTGSSPLIRIFRPNGLKVTEFYAYDEKFRGGVNITSGDLDGDRIKEILTVPKEKGGPHLKIFNHNGELINHFLVYDKDFRGGVNIASGDLNGDGLDEIIVGPQKGNLPLRVFDRSGRILSEFYAYDKNFKGGVSLVTSDLNGDGVQEIITGAGPGGGPQVRVFDLSGRVKGQFFAYHKDFPGGINVAAGDLDGDGLDEVVVSIASGASPYVRIFNSSFYLLAQFMAYDKNFQKGVFLSIEDLDGDRKKEIITGPFKGGGPHLRFFDAQGEVKGQFFAYEKSFDKGLSLTTIKKFE